MRLPTFTALFLLVFVFLSRGDLSREIEGQAAAARSILDTWHGQDPEPGNRKLHLVYWTPSDRAPARDYHPRLTRIMEHIRDFYSKEMERLGFGPKSFNLAYDEESELVIHLVKGAGPYRDYDVQSGTQIRKECVPVLRQAGVDAQRETVLIFCNLAEWDADQLVFRHRSPYYAGGTHQRGTAWQLDSPELDTVNLPKLEPIIHDGQYGRISLGKHNTIFIGGIAHELGHALGLPHNKGREDERAAGGVALMGSGNRNYGDEVRKEGKGAFLTLAHGLRLASHPQFSGSVKGMSQRAEMTMSGLSVELDSEGFTFHGNVQGSPPVYAVIGYCDPEGGGDYNATTATAVPDADGRFTLRCRSLAKGKTGTLRLVACHVNGAASTNIGTNSRYQFPYRVSSDGTAEVSAMQQRFALEPLVSALKERDWETVEAELGQLDGGDLDGADGATLRIGERLVAALKGGSEMKAVSAFADGKAVPLSSCPPSLAKVGWGRPAYDHTPDDGLLVSAGGRLWEGGIHAHAPARHRYGLDGGWKRLAGACGLSDGHGGSVIFVIKADGEEVFRSRILKSGSMAEYDIDLDGVGDLELVVEDGGDGNGGDWGMWLDPILSR